MGNENSREDPGPRDTETPDNNRNLECADNYSTYTTIDFSDSRSPQSVAENVEETLTDKYVKEGKRLRQDIGVTFESVKGKFAGIREHLKNQMSKSSVDKTVDDVPKVSDEESYVEFSEILMGRLDLKEGAYCGVEDGDGYSQKVTRFDPQQVKVGEMIGEGGFGRVFQATLDGSITVASKLIMAPIVVTEELNQLLTLDHKNLAKVIGVVRQSSEMDPPQLLLEYFPEGNLRMYLKRHGTPKDDDTLGRLALEISEGCQFLHKCNVVHGNLAARNILVEKNTKEGEIRYNAKISDIGLIRFAEPSGMNYVKVPRAVSLRWVPKEIIDGSDFTFSSDVWSFGVILWEMWTHGSIPYGLTFSNPRIIQFLNDGYSPLAIYHPPRCPKNIVAIMESIFQVIPVKRPTFTELLTKLQQYEGHCKITASEPSRAEQGGEADQPSPQSSASVAVVENIEEKANESSANVNEDNKPQKNKKGGSKNKISVANPNPIQAKLATEDQKIDNSDVGNPKTIGEDAKTPDSADLKKEYTPNKNKNTKQKAQVINPNSASALLQPEDTMTENAGDGQSKSIGTDANTPDIGRINLSQNVDKNEKPHKKKKRKAKSKAVVAIHSSEVKTDNVDSSAASAAAELAALRKRLEQLEKGDGEKGNAAAAEKGNALQEHDKQVGIKPGDRDGSVREGDTFQSTTGTSVAGNETMVTPTPPLHALLYGDEPLPYNPNPHHAVQLPINKYEQEAEDEEFEIIF